MRARNAVSTFMSQGAPGVTCSPMTMPSDSHRCNVPLDTPRSSSASAIVITSTSVPSSPLDRRSIAAH
jgi:hypothetical protein